MNSKKLEANSPIEWSANALDALLTKLEPTKTETARLTNAKEKMLRTSRLYLQVAKTQTECA